MVNDRYESCAEVSREELIDLINLAGNGMQDAFDKLKDLYKPLMESQIHKHAVTEMSMQDVDDMRQEALLHFCNAVCSYDCSSESVDFGLYAKICISNGLVSFVRSYYRRHKKKILSLESEGFGDKMPYVYADMLQSIVEKEQLTSLVDTIRASLSDYENKIWWLYVSGMSISEISEKLGGVGTKSISNAVYRIRKKLRVFLSDQNQI
jgi:RNA polymerase sigma factor (sigma-70 family)